MNYLKRSIWKYSLLGKDRLITGLTHFSFIYFCFPCNFLQKLHFHSHNFASPMQSWFICIFIGRMTSKLHKLLHFSFVLFPKMATWWPKHSLKYYFFDFPIVIISSSFYISPQFLIFYLSFEFICPLVIIIIPFIGILSVLFNFFCFSFFSWLSAI